MTDNKVEDLELTFLGIGLEMQGIPRIRKASRQVRQKFAEEMDAAIDSVSIGSSLWNAKEPAVKAFRKAYSKVRGAFKNPYHTLPTGDPGTRMVRKNALTDLQAAVQSAAEEFREAATELSYQLDAIKTRERIRRGDLFKESDYDLQAIRRCNAVFTFRNLEPPRGLAQVSPKIYQEEIRKQREALQEIVRHAESSLANELLESVRRLSERLEPDADGSRKKFRESTVRGLMNRLDSIQSVLQNTAIGGDVFDNAIENLRSILGTASAEGVTEGLRNDEGFREQVSEACRSAMDQLLDSIQSRGRRIDVLPEAISEEVA